MAAYLDYNATAPVRPEALEKMLEVLAAPANPSSSHAYGRTAKKYLEEARAIVADAVSAFADEVIFTGSGTEANTTALCGFPDRRVLVSAVEHSSVLKSRADAKTIPVTAAGVVDVSALEKLLAVDAKPALVSVMLANNENGIIQPLAEIATLCRKHNALLHCDAIQALGKIPVDFGALGADMLSVSAHKCGGPVGAAALVVRRNLPFQPLFKGGKQEMGRRAGTVNVAAIAAFGEAIRQFDFQRMQTLRGWFDAMEKEIEAAGGVVFGKSSPRLPNTCMAAMPGVTNDTQMIDFDLKGFAISAGAACSSGKIEISHVLAAMSVPENIGLCAIRISGGWNTREQEVKDFAVTWKKLSGRLAKAA